MTPLSTIVSRDSTLIQGRIKAKTIKNRPTVDYTQIGVHIAYTLYGIIYPVTDK